VLAVVPLLLLAQATMASPPRVALPELSAGVSSIFYAHAFEYATGSSLDVTLTMPVLRNYGCGAGLRLGLATVAPEAFVRFLVMPQLGAWRPGLGLELGLTARASFDAGPLTRTEVRAPIEAEKNPWYLAIHASPLSYAWGKGWRFAVAELRLGTHLAPLGRFVRIELGLFTLGYRL
jgi:hypothetical protein